MCAVTPNSSNAYRDDLIQYLRPFAAEGKEVGDGDIQAFFDARKAGGSS